MKKRTVLKKYDALTLTLEAETLSVNFSDRKRSVKLTLCAETDGSVSKTVEAERNGSLYALGVSYSVPKRFVISGQTRTVISEYTASVVDFESYPSSGVANLKLFYQDEDLGVFPSEVITVFSIGRIYTKPEARLLSQNVDLGSAVCVLSSMEAEGYSLHCALYDGNTLLSEDDMDGDTLNIPTTLQYVRSHPTDAAFDANVVISASLSGSSLPETLTLPLTLKIPDGQCLPEASVHAEVCYTDENSEVFGVPLKLRSYLNITVPTVIVYSGAHVVSTEIYIDGINKGTTPVTSGVFTVSGVHTWQVVVTDTRGLKNTYSGSVTVYDYGMPAFDSYVKRTDLLGNESPDGVFIRAKATVTDMYMTDCGNTYSLRLGYRRAGVSDQFTYVTLTDGTEAAINGSLDPSYSYETVIECTDLAGSTSTANYLLECDRVEINVAKNKVGIGKYATENHLLDCAWSIKTAGDVNFSDGNGNSVSMRNFYNKLQRNVPCNLEVVTEESEIEALATKYDTNVLDDGCYLIILVCKANGLSFSYGVHILLGMKDTEENIFFMRELDVL